MKKRFFVMVLAVVLLVGMMPGVLAADGAQDMANAALRYLEKVNGPDLGFGTENWCGYFLYRCGEDAGQTAALGGSSSTMASTNSAMKWFAGGNGTVACFYNEVIATGRYGLNGNHKGNKSDYTPQVGDIIFFDWDGDHNNLGHMEVVTSAVGQKITTVGGSTGGSCKTWKTSKELHVHAHTYDVSSAYIVAYARPNYSTDTTETSAPSTLLLLPAREPGENREQGQSFQFDGCAESNYDIVFTAIQVRLNDNMTVIMEKEVTPNQKKINVIEVGVDSLPLETLEEGQYNFWWLVKDASGTLKSWVAHFSVGDPNAATPSPAPTPTPTPTSKPDKPSTTPTPSCANGHSYKVDGETDTTVYYVCVNCGDSYEEAKEQIREPETVQGLPLPTVQTYRDGQFRDVSAQDWFSDNVADAYAMGLMKGTGEGIFSPGNNMTLAEAVTLAARIHKLYDTGSDAFPSYDGGNWYDPYVDYAMENSIVNTYYNYTRPATREEFVHILAQALPETALENIAGRISFADEGDMTYLADVRLLSGAGVINGIEQGGMTYFKPNAAITRAEVAAVVARMGQPEARLGR